MGWNPLSGFQNIFGGGSSYARQPDDYGTDYSGYNTSPMKKAFTENEPWVTGEGYNKSAIGRGLQDSFANYDVKSPYEINQHQDELDKFKPGPALQSYLDYSDEMPNRADYQPGKWGSFVAALAGGAEGYKSPAQGVKTALAMREEPYRRATTDYEARLKDMHDAAQLESQAENYEAMSGYRNYGAVTGRYRAAAQQATADERMQMNRAWNLARMGDMTERQKMEKDKFDQGKYQFGVTSGETHRHDVATEGIGNRNATTAEGSLRDREKGTRIQGANVESQIDERANKPKPSLPTESRGPSPSEFDSADRQASQEVARQNPGRFGNFIDKNGNAVPPHGWMTGAPYSNPAYDEFLAAQKRRRDEIIHMSHPDWVIYDPASPNNIKSAPGVQPRQVPY
jgi:hypothetical protein